MYKRTLTEIVKSRLGTGKAILIFEPRQVGKTTMILNLLEGQNHLFLDADDPTVRSLLENINTEELKALIGKNKTVFIDEAQRIPNIGLTLKIITDQFKEVQLLASGSSSFELANAINEPLTGRKWEYQLYPISWHEMEENIGLLKARQQLELRIQYGFYPDVINNPGGEKDILKQLVGSYLYKDILSYAGIKKPDILEKLVQALALQIGNEVSYNELAQLLGIDKNTVSSYIGLLEQAYVIFKLGSFSRNLRNEIKTNRKIYFYDLGLRNMVIGNFNPLELRSDKGALWENFLIAERLKQNSYAGGFAKSYFWRTVQQQEIDYIEEVDGRLAAFEFKWNPKAKVKNQKVFTQSYGVQIETINQSNFRSFVNL